MNGKQVEIRRYYGYIQEMASMFSDWLLKASMAQTGDDLGRGYTGISWFLVIVSPWIMLSRGDHSTSDFLIVHVILMRD